MIEPIELDSFDKIIPRQSSKLLKSKRENSERVLNQQCCSIFTKRVIQTLELQTNSHSSYDDDYVQHKRTQVKVGTSEGETRPTAAKTQLRYCDFKRNG